MKWLLGTGLAASSFTWVQPGLLFSGVTSVVRTLLGTLPLIPYKLPESQRVRSSLTST